MAQSKFKRDIFYFLIIAILAGTCGWFYYGYHFKPASEREVKVYYNHDTQANEKIIRTIQDADQFVYFAIYTFTRQDIADALLGAKHRGLKVAGIVDRKQATSLDSQKDLVTELQKSGIDIVFNDHNYIMHLKTVVTDNGYVSGSYNWTAAATDNNDEIIEVGRDETIRKQYEQTLKEIIEKYRALSPD